MDTSSTNHILNSLSQFSLQPDDMPQPLYQATDETMFWLHDGPPLRNMRDLLHSLDNITEEQFQFHVGDEKNDFASWVENVLKDSACAEELYRCKAILSTRRVLIKFLKNYL